jgi:hypothetical protein
MKSRATLPRLARGFTLHDVTYVELPPEEHRHVQVQLDDGLWYEGWLESYRKVEGVWSGLVRYAPEPGAEGELGWFEEPRIRGF